MVSSQPKMTQPVCYDFVDLEMPTPSLLDLWIARPDLLYSGARSTATRQTSSSKSDLEENASTSFRTAAKS